MGKIKLTRKEAIRLSILKWEWIVKNEGQFIGLLEDHPELTYINCNCGLCEKYLETESATLICCAKCPIRPRITNYYDKNEVGCMQRYAPFWRWEKNETVENAQAVLDLIKSVE